MIRTGFSALRVVSRGFGIRTQVSAFSVFCQHFSSDVNLNDKLKDYVMKQDLKKNFTEYKSAADRKELFREVYLDLMKDGKMMKGNVVDTDCGCLLCKVPEHLITYLNVGLLRLFIHESGSIYSRHVTGTCKKHQRKITRCIKHARTAGLIPFQLTPKDYEMYDMFVGGEKEKEEEEPVEESLSEKLNKKENASAEEVSSEDFVKLMNLLSAEEKDEQGDE